MKAKKIILIASGESKAEAIKGLFSGKITTDNPASMLQMHRDVVVIVDKEAAKLIEKYNKIVKINYKKLNITY